MIKRTEKNVHIMYPKKEQRTFNENFFSFDYNINRFFSIMFVLYDI